MRIINCLHYFVSDGPGVTCIGCGKKYVDARFVKQMKEQCTRTHDYGYGNGYIPHDEKGNRVKNLTCIHCHNKLKEEV